MVLGLDPLIAAGVLASTATTDAAYVFFNAAVVGGHRFRAANWSAVWYLLSAFAVISYTENALYVLFAATDRGLARSPRSPGCAGAKGRAPRPATTPRNRQCLFRISALRRSVHSRQPGNGNAPGVASART